MILFFWGKIRNLYCKFYFLQGKHDFPWRYILLFVTFCFFFWQGMSSPLAYFYLQCNVSHHTCPFIICIFNVFMRACISVYDHTFKSIYIACMYAKYFQYSVSEIERFANHFSKQYTETILSPAPSRVPTSTQTHTRNFFFFFLLFYYHDKRKQWYVYIW